MARPENREYKRHDINASYTEIRHLKNPETNRPLCNTSTQTKILYDEKDFPVSCNSCLKRSKRK